MTPSHTNYHFFFTFLLRYQLVYELVTQLAVSLFRNGRRKHQDIRESRKYIMEV